MSPCAFLMIIQLFCADARQPIMRRVPKNPAGKISTRQWRESAVHLSASGEVKEMKREVRLMRREKRWSSQGLTSDGESLGGGAKAVPRHIMDNRKSLEAAKPISLKQFPWSKGATESGHQVSDATRDGGEGPGQGHGHGHAHDHGHGHGHGHDNVTIAGEGETHADVIMGRLEEHVSSGENECLEAETVDSAGVETSELKVIKCKHADEAEDIEWMYVHETKQIRLQARQICLEADLSHTSATEHDVIARVCLDHEDHDFIHQQWDYDPAVMEIKFSASGQCLTTHPHQEHVHPHHKHVHLAPCDTQNEGQKWHVASHSVGGSEDEGDVEHDEYDYKERHVGKIEQTGHKKNMCLDAEEVEDTNTEVRELKEIPCDESSEKDTEWTWEDSHQIRLKDKELCLHADPDEDEVYSHVCLLPVESDFHMQEWEYDHADHEIKMKSATHNKCLTSTENSTKVHLATCADHEDQKWQFTADVALSVLGDAETPPAHAEPSRVPAEP